MTSYSETAAFEREAARLRPRLAAMATTMLKSEADADDAVQETLLKLWFFRERLAEYNSVEAPAVVILRRVCLNMLRSRSRSPFSNPETLPEIADTAPVDNDISDELLRAIDSLPSTEQAVLRLRHLDGMEIEDIAALTLSNVGAVRTALSRARKRIRDKFLNL